MAKSKGKTTAKSKKRSTPKKNTSARSGSASKNNAVADESQRRIKQEIVAIVLIAVGAFLAFGLLFDSAGKVGMLLNKALSGCFGIMSYALPFFMIAYGIIILIGKSRAWSVRPMIFTIIIFILLNILFAASFVTGEGLPVGGAGFSEIFKDSVNRESGGIVGMYAAMLVVKLIGKAGLYIITIALIIISAIVIINTPMSTYAGAVREKHLSKREKRAQLKVAREAARAADDEEEIDDGRLVSGSEKELLSNSLDSNEKAALKIPSFLDSDRIKEGNSIIDAMKNDETYGVVDGDSFEGLRIDDTNLPFEPDFIEQTEIIEQPVLDTAGVDDEGPHSRFVLADIDKDLTPYENIPSKMPDDSHLPSFLKTEKTNTSAGIHFDGGNSDESNYKFPPLSLLTKGKGTTKSENQSDLKRNAAKLEQALRDFRVEAKVTKVTVGPTVTRYEVEPDVGVKIQSIRSLEPDLALKLEVTSVRVVPMPGQSVIGIEAINSKINIVTLREILESPEYQENESKTAFVLGKNISGNKIVADLKDMPHLLIAGTTGSGKSVCINSILLSLLYRAKPSELKLILIDPKSVELEFYNEIPHLLVPVVTEPERAAMALGYAVTIMTDRYKKFSEHKVRNLDGYNEKMIKDGTLEEVLPKIVIIIDELSDLMSVASAKVQESISRLAAMARAAGMHLVVATQQPLASILTSVIKANIPSRIALSVSSNSHSRVILDSPGAERLQGNGDMLFSPVGTREPMRIQGSYVSDEEIRKVTEFIKKQMDPEYSSDVMQVVVTGPTNNLVDDEDELFRDAVEMVMQSNPRQASVSMIQRRFRIGYNRAARLVDMMEERGIVGMSEGSNKPRLVIMSDAEIATFLGNPVQSSFLDDEGEIEEMDEYE